MPTPSRFHRLLLLAFAATAIACSKAPVLGNATCNLEARSASLYWHIAVSWLGEQGTPVLPDEYKVEMAYWPKILGLLVTDPAKK